LKRSRASARVLFIAFRIAPDDARYIKLRQSLIDDGFQVSALAPGGAAASHASVRAIGRAPQAGGNRLMRSAAARHLAWQIAGAAAQERPDVIIAFDPESLPSAIAAKQRARARLIFDAHEYHAEEDPSDRARGLWVQRMERRADPHLDGFVTVNDSIAQRYRADGRIAQPALVVRNTVDPQPRPHYDGRLHTAAGLPADTRILLYHGGLKPWRGLDALTDAAPGLPPGWAVTIMGDGPLAEDLRRRAGDRLRLIPPVPHSELSLWLQGAALGAVLYEPVGENQRLCSPNKLWEYPAAGTPVLGRNLPEIRRTLEQGRHGWLIPAGGGAEAIVAQIGTLTDDALDRARVAAAGYAERQSWSKEVALFLAMVRRQAGVE
jgi:glycosyltransferase involved in cell wall biosynthesis